MSTPATPTSALSSMEDAPDFGPDSSRMTDAPGEVKPNGKPKPKPVQEVLDKLKIGENKKARTPGLRKLTDEDRDKIASWYMAGGMMVTAFRPNAGKLMALSAEDAANAWIEWADQNDSVRRWILKAVEGGSLGKILALNIPILLALAIPESVWKSDALPPVLQLFNPEMAIAGLEMRDEMRRQAA